MPSGIALTGATGFLGRRLAPALAAKGWRVRVLARRPLAAAAWEGEPPDWVVGDLADSAALARLTAGAEVVIHAAGLIKALSRAQFFAINAEGAERVARAAPGRMVLVSSLAAREPRLSGYAASKRAGEAAARAVLGERLTVIRPPAIYGPGDRETLGLFRLAAKSPFMPVPADPTARLALAFVDDVAAEICAAAAATAGGGTYAIGGARPAGYGWSEIMSAAAEAVGRPARPIPLPLGFISAAGAVTEVFATASGRAAIFGRGKAREILHPDWSVGAHELGPWAAAGRPTALGAGFARTVAWYRARGWL